MRNYLIFLVIALCSTLLCFAEDSTSPAPKDAPVSPTTTTEQTPQSLEQIFAKPFTGTFKVVQVRDLLGALRQKGPLNIVATKEVSGELTFLLENVTVGEALEIVLITNGLAKEIKGNIIHIMTEAQYQALYGKPYNSRLIVKIYQLKNTLPKRIMTFLENIRSKNLGSLIGDDGTRTLVVIDVPDKIKEMEELIKRLDVSSDTQTFELKNAKMDDIIPEVTKLRTPGFGEIQIDKRMNRFIVTDHPQVLQDIANLVYQFDAKPREVLIEAKMIQIVLSDEFTMGVNWQQVFSKYSAFKDVKLVGNFPIRGDLAQKVNLTTTIGTIPNTHYQLVVQALKNFGDNKLISSPRLITLSDKEAKFMVGTKEAYATTTRTTAQGGATTETETVQFLEVGVTLMVTPTINEDKYITMLIKPEISSVTRYEVTALGNRIPIIETANTSTNVMVKDGVPIVIAGLIRDQKQRESGGVPLLSQIPIIGLLFSSKREYFVKTETVVFLTPFIVTGDVDSSVISRQIDLERKEPKELKPIR
ncbi:MAG: secretin N-terminal domain-containing protein [Planctomycetota bacterium]